VIAQIKKGIVRSRKPYKFAKKKNKTVGTLIEIGKKFVGKLDWLAFGGPAAHIGR